MPSRRPSRTPHLAALLTLALVAGSTFAEGPRAQAVAHPGAVSADRSATPGHLGQQRDPAQERQGYPRQTTLAVPPVDGSDAAVRLGLTPYHELAPRLNELQARSTRVSAEVIGGTVTGRELYLVTLTSPESAVQASRQERIRERIVDQPAQAARAPGLAERYKTPVFVNANIHGNEWEGTDAALRLIEDYATSDDPAVRHTLDSSRIHLVVSANPDGRHDNTRGNSSGFNLNRDFVTASQPEVVAVRDTLIRTQPMVMLDLHGYVNGTLIEPSTPPHGENYEYDLFLKHAYPNGLGIEEAVLDLGYTQQEDGLAPPQIPFRDSEQGWDDWPPIFTPQYAALHGATAAHTIEMPMRVNRTDYDDQPAEELRRRSAINTDVAHAAMTASIGYAVEHRDELLADQIEIFRRGQAGEPQRPVTSEGVPEAAPHDVYLTDYPRAYLIPTGQGQRSETAAARLVDHLIANDVEVTRAGRPVAVDGTTYPAGSYVVDMHQSKRGMANAILAAGTDVSERVDAVYDISAWSHGLLWGADVTTVPEGTDLDVVGRLVEAAAPTGSVEGSGDLVLGLEDPDDVAALNSLLTSGVAVQWLDEGTVLVPAGARDQAERVARDFGVQLRAADAGEEGTDLAGLEIAAAATPEELWALEEMGFSVTEVNPAILNDGFDWSAVDSLYVSSGLSWGSLDGDARADLTTYLSRGGGLVGRGGQGAALNEATDLLELDAVTGRGDANGVAAVDSADSPIAGGATPHTFVYSPTWFTDLGEEVTVDQRYAAQEPLVSGHWRPETSGAGGPDDAAGEAVVVSGLDESGAAVVLFGSEPLFRAHPKGQYSLVAKALIWSAVEGT